MKMILNRISDKGDCAILCQVQDFQGVAKPDMLGFLLNNMHITVRVFLFFDPAVNLSSIDQFVELIQFTDTYKLLLYQL